MKTFTVDTDRLGAVILRQAPVVRADPNTGELILDDKTKRPIYQGRVLIPGVPPTAFSPPGVGQVRLKMLDEPGSQFRDGQLVRLAGRVLITHWYSRQQFGRPASSEVTVRPDQLVDATGDRLPQPGYLPVKMDEEPFLLLDVVEPDRPRDGRGVHAIVMVPPSVIDEDGVMTVEMFTRPDNSLLGKPVRFEQLAVRIIQPDREDVGRSAKSELQAVAEGITAAEPVFAGAAAGNGRRARQEPTPEPAGEAQP